MVYVYLLDKTLIAILRFRKQDKKETEHAVAVQKVNKSLEGRLCYSIGARWERTIQLKCNHQLFFDGVTLTPTRKPPRFMYGCRLCKLSVELDELFCVD